MGLSVFIICQNEERIIERTLSQARKVADELIVVDSGSTDRTLEIAKSYADRIEHQDWLGYSGQKNFALSLCTQDWCLSIDADEVLTDALIAEIKLSLRAECEAIHSGSPRRFAPRDDSPLAEAYRIPRKLYIGSKWIHYGGYYPDYQLRLFRRQIASFAPREVHESLTLNVEARISDLKEPLEHYAYADVQDLEQTFMRYADLAHESHAKLRHCEQNEPRHCEERSDEAIHCPISTVWASLKFIYTFIWRYIIRLGFLQGLLGLQLAWIHAKYTYRKYA